MGSGQQMFRHQMAILRRERQWQHWHRMAILKRERQWQHPIRPPVGKENPIDGDGDKQTMQGSVKMLALSKIKMDGKEIKLLLEGNFKFCQFWSHCCLVI